jgi:predicted ATPase
MRRLVLTGTPGAGKTAILRHLELDGHVVVEEAATDVIGLEQARGDPHPWTRPSFIDAVVALQQQRQLRTVGGDVQFFDRSPVCTLALCRWLGRPVPLALSQELDRIERAAVYDRGVLFVDRLGFVTPTAARRITSDEAVHFERVHEEVYRSFGYECVHIRPGTLADRIEALRRLTDLSH